MEDNYSKRLNKVIPGGAHTYSRGDDQYPSNAPSIFKRGKGAYVYTPEEDKFLDYGMALRAVSIGYSEDEIDNAAITQIKYGNNLTRASLVELEAAELFCSLIDSVDMVKFTKNGSTAVSAAVKLARAYTGKDLVARCAQHPFFSYDDWFIGSTEITKGIPQNIIEQTKYFNFNDIKSAEELFSKHHNQIACVVLEPATTEEPQNEFLHKLRELCNKSGAVFILDEMITGFRWHLKGAQHFYNVEADLCTFGKSMANGFSVAAVAGKREIMQLGSIDREGAERVFLLSTTHGAEMNGLGAFIKTIEYHRKYDVVSHLWSYGDKLKLIVSELTKKYELEKYFKIIGPSCSPAYLTYDKNEKNSLAFRTLFSQEMIKNGVLMPWIALSYRHGEKELELTRRALDETLKVYKMALETSFEKYLNGKIIKPVFRKFN